MPVYAASNAGQAIRVVAPDYVAQGGETLFDHVPTPDELGAAFTGFAAAAAIAAAPVQYAALIAAGLQITSTATAALNATYGTTPQDQFNIVALEVSLAQNEGFPPGGVATYDYPDQSDAPHTVNEAQFTAIAAAIRDFVAGANRSLALKLAGQGAEWPAAAAQIA